MTDPITYDSYDNVLSETDPAAGDRFRFTGREWDVLTGLYYYRARYYDPAAGRFISLDPLGFDAGDANQYRYVGNAPTMYRDPLGWMAVEDGAFHSEDAKQAPAKALVGCLAAEAFTTIAFAAAGFPPNLLDIGGSIIQCAVAPGAGAADDIADAGKAAGKAVRFAPGTAQSALSKMGRIDHAGRHLSDFGIIAGKQGTKAFREAVRSNAKRILESPLNTFDHVMKQGGLAVKGFHGKIDGKDVVLWVAKESRGKIDPGDLVTAVIPTPQQVINWGLK